MRELRSRAHIRSSSSPSVSSPFPPLLEDWACKLILSQGAPVSVARPKFDYSWFSYLLFNEVPSYLQWSDLKQVLRNHHESLPLLFQLMGPIAAFFWLANIKVALADRTAKGHQPERFSTFRLCISEPNCLMATSLTLRSRILKEQKFYLICSFVTDFPGDHNISDQFVSLS